MKTEEQILASELEQILHLQDEDRILNLLSNLECGEFGNILTDEQIKYFGGAERVKFLAKKILNNEE